MIGGPDGEDAAEAVDEAVGVAVGVGVGVGVGTEDVTFWDGAGPSVWAAGGAPHAASEPIRKTDKAACTTRGTTTMATPGQNSRQAPR